jgi:hypothetical protein
VIGSPRSRHRVIGFKNFLQTIDSEVPAELDPHLVLDKYSTHKTPQIKRWHRTPRSGASPHARSSKAARFVGYHRAAAR